MPGATGEVILSKPRFEKLFSPEEANHLIPRLEIIMRDLQLMANNNIKMNKAVSVLGAFSTTAGFFEISAKVTAYFQNVTAIQSVISNSASFITVLNMFVPLMWWPSVPHSVPSVKSQDL